MIGAKTFGKMYRRITWGLVAPMQLADSMYGRWRILMTALRTTLEVPGASKMPFRYAPRDAVVQRSEIALHGRWLEGYAQRLAMQAMLIDIHQYQSAGEQAIDPPVSHGLSHGKSNPLS